MAPKHDPADDELLAGYWSETQFAKQIRRARRTLKLWRANGMGPPFVTVGVAVLYPKSSAAEWLASLVRQPSKSGG